MNDLTNIGGGANSVSNELTATHTHVYNGITFIGNGTDEMQIGGLYVNSISNFSVTIVSGKDIILKWTNPSVIRGKPYTGVIINYSTDKYPGIEGTQIYKGTGNTYTPESESTISYTLPLYNTTYYFSCIPYTIINSEEFNGNILNTSISIGSIDPITKTFTGSTTYTIPSGYTKMDVFCVGGGGNGGGKSSSSSYTSGQGGGAGGYTKTTKNISIASGQTLSISVGGGSYPVGGGTALSGGTSSVSRSGTTLSSATGGGGVSTNNVYGGNGGSGGGGGSYGGPGNGGASNGGSDGSIFGGKGQGTTTRAFGESSGTLYAGGGGGGSFSGAAGAGGSPGGGHGGGSRGNGTSAAGNTGSGGGGSGGGNNSGGTNGGNGGSGIVLIKLY